MGELFRADTARRQPVRLKSAPEKGQLLDVLLLGQVRGMMTHFTKAGPVCCLGSGRCPPKHHLLRQVWKGYAPSYHWVGQPDSCWVKSVVELTEHAFQGMRGQLLRGTQWKLARLLDKDGNWPVHAFYECEWPEGEVPGAFDVVPVLMRPFGGGELRLDIDCPMECVEQAEVISSRAPRDVFAQTVPQSMTEAELAAFREQLRQFSKGGPK